MPNNHQHPKSLATHIAVHVGSDNQQTHDDFLGLKSLPGRQNTLSETSKDSSWWWTTLPVISHADDPTYGGEAGHMRSSTPRDQVCALNFPIANMHQPAHACLPRQLLLAWLGVQTTQASCCRAETIMGGPSAIELHYLYSSCVPLVLVCSYNAPSCLLWARPVTLAC